MMLLSSADKEDKVQVLQKATLGKHALAGSIFSYPLSVSRIREVMTSRVKPPPAA